MIRDVVLSDAARIAAIYNYYVCETTVTFEEAPVSEEEMNGRLRDHRGPWLVLERDGLVQGYAYAKPWHSRSAYRHSFESTIYLDRQACGRGDGRLLYEALLAKLSARSLHLVVGVIAQPNAASVALHERLGFKQTGLLPEVGHKLGAWVDVGYWTRILGR